MTIFEKNMIGAEKDMFSGNPDLDLSFMDSHDYVVYVVEMDRVNTFDGTRRIQVNPKSMVELDPYVELRIFEDGCIQCSLYAKNGNYKSYDNYLFHHGKYDMMHGTKIILPEWLKYQVKSIFNRGDGDGQS